MKTTLDLPEELLDEAMEVCGARTKREAVMRALVEMNRRERLRKLTERLGHSTTFMSFEELMELRGPETPSRRPHREADRSHGPH